ncbi:pilus assembly protein PilM [Bacillus sp. AGMB 02131]|uniref:Pilus assembly protein PilM n=1 Tax=Peribacillus faecalis TaxID=2772559 RepID=A0A927CVH4_9BACI|nr:pilus assembly protein PilM [Peribacillus faecalis]MBD3107831.1 pilus assembly protein PilM [Peribacillus faecalis]
MGLSIFNKRDKVINIEIKDHVIRYTEVASNDSLSVHSMGEYLLPSGIIRDGKIEDPFALTAILEQCVDEWKIARRKVRFLVPDQHVLVRRLKIEQEIADDEIEGHLYLQLGTSIHLPFEEPVFDVIVLGEKDGQKEILIFAASEQIVKQYSDLLQECKLKPSIFDIVPLANYRLYHSLYDCHEGEHIMFLHFDLYGVNVSVFENDKPSFMRYLPISSDKEQWEIVNDSLGFQRWEYKVDKDQYYEFLIDMYTEIDRVVTFYKFNVSEEQQEISSLVIMGDHPFLSTIVEQMKNRFNMPVRSLLDTDRSNEKIRNIDYQYYLPIGLALRGGD